MVGADDVRKLALALTDVSDDSEPGRLRYSVAGKGIVWTYFERIEPKKPRRARPDMVAVRCLIEKKEMLIEAAPDIYFDDDHYRGFPAVLVRLAAIEADELDQLLRGAWSIQAPKRLRAQH